VDKDYDAIVIGSGMGGLAVASVLAQFKRYRVMVLEQHFKIGGFTHTFQRPGGYCWDVGLHYVGEMGEGSVVRRAMDFITGRKVQWVKMKDPFEVFLYPGLRFEVPSDRQAYLERLIGLFPDEAEALRDYWNDLDAADRALKAPADPKVDDLVSQSLRSYLTVHFKDDRLKGLLASQWGDYGLPPHLASFGTHATIVRHYLEGGYYPVGSSSTLADSVLTLVRAVGGDMKVRHRVLRILTEDGRVVGVEVQGPGGREVLKTNEVYSNVGAEATYGRLLAGSGPAPDDLKEISSALAYGVVTLYLGLRSRCEHLGVHGQNFWIYDRFDHDSVWEERNSLAHGKATSCYLSFPGIKDPQARKPTAEIIAPLDHEVFERWRGKPWRRRGPEYEALKERIAGALLDLVEDRLPGFRDEVVYSELSTPLTVEGFTGHRGGAIYGFPGIPGRSLLKSLGSKTPVKGLVLVGADAGGLGIAGTMMSGIRGAALQHGTKVLFHVLKVGSQAPPIRTDPAAG